MNKLHIRSCANVALVKYWGKSDTAGNIPAVGSISIGLEGLTTRTSIEVESGAADQISINGVDCGAAVARAGKFLEEVRRAFGRPEHFRVESGNDFPTGAGLASSASGFAALAIGVSELLSLGLKPREISQLARQGSGSAARSVHGGFVEMSAGPDAFAEQIACADDWPLEVVIAVTATETKATGSSEGMELSKHTSPFYESWIATHAVDLDFARAAIFERDFDKLADVSEHSCLKMHGTIMASRPAPIYWNGATVDVIHEVRNLRRQGVPVFFSIDAGPQVKIVCSPGISERVRANLQAIPGILDTIVTRVGGEPRIDGDDR